MGWFFSNVASAASVLAAILLSPYIVGPVNWFVERFPGRVRPWLWLVSWLLIAVVILGVCFLSSALLRRATRWLTRRKDRKVLPGTLQLVGELGAYISRFSWELSRERSPDAQSLRQHMEMDDICYQLLEVICWGPNVSLQRLSDTYSTERQLADTTYQHYEVELRQELRGGGTERQRIDAAKYGARCVDLLVARVRRALRQKL